MKRLSLPLFFAVVWSGLTAVGAARDYQVTLTAAEVDRAGQVVSFAVPEDGPRSPVLRDEAGRTIALQPGDSGTLSFIVPWQSAGQVLAFTLTEGQLPPAPGVSVVNQDGDLQVAVSDQTVFHYRTDPTRLPRSGIDPKIPRAGYLHPVFSPAGQVVTDDYPANHPHHHGIWAPWTKTSFQGRSPDFWNMHAGTGAEHFVALDRTWAGPVHGGLEARHEMTDLTAPSPLKVLDVTWRVTAYALESTDRPARMFDVVITHTCATPDPLILPEYHYGGFGFRGAAGWNGPGEAVQFLTSEGITDRIQGNNTRARWCYVGGLLTGGVQAGTATLGHPDNFRAPQPVRLHPNMPYFSFAPQQLGAFSIEPGRPHVMRYRFVVSDGAPDRSRIDAFWHGYALPAKPVLSAR